MKLPPGLVNNFSFSLMANIFAPLFLPIPSSESDLFSAVSKRLISLLNSYSSISHSLPARRSRKSIAIGLKAIDAIALPAAI